MRGKGVGIFCLSFLFFFLRGGSSFSENVKFDKQKNILYNAGILLGAGDVLPKVIFSIQDGKGDFRNILPQEPVAIKREEKEIRVSWKVPLQQLSFDSRVSSKDGYLSWLLTIKNQSNEEAWLKTALKVRSPGKDVTFWDGNSLFEHPEKKTVRTEFVNTFPLTCAFTNGKGIAIGIEPSQIVSYIEEGYDNDTQVLWQATKLVVFPGKTETIEFVFYPFVPGYSHYSALQIYFDSFPHIIPVKAVLQLGAWKDQCPLDQALSCRRGSRRDRNYYYYSKQSYQCRTAYTPARDIVRIVFHLITIFRPSSVCGGASENPFG